VGRVIEPIGKVIEPIGKVIEPIGKVIEPIGKSSPPQLRRGGPWGRGGADCGFKLLTSEITTPSLGAPPLLNEEGSFQEPYDFIPNKPV
jgi:hypothetical protein